MDRYTENPEQGLGFVGWDLDENNRTELHRLKQVTAKNIANEPTPPEMFFKQPGNQPGCNSMKSA